MRLRGIGSRLRATALVAALVAGAVAFAVVLAAAADLVAGDGVGPDGHAVLDVARAAGATVLLLLLCGLAPARLLAPQALRPWAPLLALPLGACIAGLGLTLLRGFAVPMDASLAILLASGAAGALLTGRERAPVELGRLAPAALVAAAIACLVVVPLLRSDSLATVIGGNGDAHLATGAAELVQDARPGEERTELPIDHMPPVWNSRYPIIYVLAGSSRLAGLDPVATFTVVSAVLTASVALAFFLVGVLLLGAGPWGSLLVMALATAGRGALNLTFVPFYNLLWGLLGLSLVLVAGWLHLRDPSARTLALFGIVAAIAFVAYPLLSPFLALFVVVAGVAEWRRRRRAGSRPDWLALRSLPRRRWARRAAIALGILAALLAIPLTWAAFDKVEEAVVALAPGGDLGPYYTPGDPFARWREKFGMPEGAPWGVLLALALACVGLWRAPRESARPLAAFAAALLVAVLLLRQRDGAQLFHLRTLSFLGPVALALAGAGVAWLVTEAWRRRSGPLVPAALAGVGLAAAVGYASVQEARQVRPFVSRDVWEVREWGERLPASGSVRVDVRPYGLQQWAGYMLSPHPLTATDPLTKFFPHPPIGRRADFLLVNRRKPARDADGPPVRENETFALYRMRRDVPGPETASRELVDPFEVEDGETE